MRKRKLETKRNSFTISIEIKEIDIRNSFNKEKLMQVRYIDTYRLNIFNLLYRTYYGFKLLEFIHNSEAKIYTDILDDKARKEFMEEDTDNSALFGIVITSTRIQLYFLFKRIIIYFDRKTINMLKRIKKELKDEKVSKL